MSNIAFGYKRPPDRSEDLKYLMPRRGITRSHRMWFSPGALDQGTTSQCVAYSGFKYLTTGPVMNLKPKERPADLYRECLKVDEWPGEDWDGGTSVRALFKVFQRLGYVSGYSWAFEAAPIVAHVLEVGPVVMGTNWHREMADPDKWGYIRAKGEIDGGHAWCIVGADRSRRNPDGSMGAVRMVNSWGPSWGPQKGRAWVTLQDLDKLIKAEGEACVATELDIAALTPSTEVA